MIPYADITEKGDRRWTSRLLERLVAPDLPTDELDDLVGALQAVSDPRSFGPLEVVVCDTGRPPPVRNAAAAALCGLHHVALYLLADKLRRWWLEGDAVLRRIALLFMDGIRCPDIVVKVAADPTHPLQADALGRMDVWFDLPQHEAVKIAGLFHPSPKQYRWSDQTNWQRASISSSQQGSLLPTSAHPQRQDGQIRGQNRGNQEPVSLDAERWSGMGFPKFEDGWEYHLKKN